MDNFLTKKFEWCLKRRQMSRPMRILSEPSCMYRYLNLQLTKKTPGKVKPVSAQLFWGDRMTVMIPEVVSTELYFNHFPEEPVIYAMLGLVKEGMTVFDIGAHFGSYSLLAAKLVGLTGCVHAFEPTPSTYNILRKNVNGRENIIAHNLAAYSENTSIQFRDYGLGRSAFNTLFSARIDEQWEVESEIQVQAIKLDEFSQKLNVFPDFVKIDAESAEYYVLLGMRYLVERKRPIISLEVGDVGAAQIYSSKDVVRLLTTDFGYRCYEYVGQGLFSPHMGKQKYEYDNLIFADAFPACLLEG
ncbi:MAG: FkbM family methyltransferase [Pseudomonadota bacterium]